MGGSARIAARCPSDPIRSPPSTCSSRRRTSRTMTIFGYQRQLAARGAADDHVRQLVFDSAQIVFGELTALTRTARQLAGRWIDESVLDPTAAEQTLRSLDAELRRVEADRDAIG